MSLVTTCPACGTTFKVTPEQLSAHRGDVCCGQCYHVFNALQQLTEIGPGTAAPAPAPEPPQQEVAEPAAEVNLIPLPEAEADTADEIEIEEFIEAAVPESEPEPVLEGMVEAVPLTVAEELPESVAPSTTLDFELELPDQETIPEEITQEEIIYPATPIEPEPVVEPPATPPAVPDSVPEPEQQPTQPTASSFLLEEQPARRQWRWLLAPFALLLLLVAAGQAAFFLRTDIAAHYPTARPWLVEVCTRLHCTVDLPRQADLLNIEDSELQDDPEHEGVLVLVSVLYNRAPYPQAYPLLELTLTDTLDQPVLRRILQPQEYLSKGTDIGAGIAAGGEAHSRVFLTVAGDKPAGYRLFVRY